MVDEKHASAEGNGDKEEFANGRLLEITVERMRMSRQPGAIQH